MNQYGQAALRRSATIDGNSSSRSSLLHNFHPMRRRWWQRRLEVIDRFSPQNQVLQELYFIRPGLLGHVRKPFIRVAPQEHDALQELAKAHRKR